MCTPRTAAISSARRPSSVSRIARARSASPRSSDFDRARNTACSAASAVSFDFPGICDLRNPHPRKIIHSLAHSQAVCHENGLLSALSRGFGRGFEGDLIAEAFKAALEIGNGAALTDLVEIGVSEIAISHAPGEHVIGGHDNLVSDGQGGTQSAAPGLEAVELVPQIAAFGPRRGNAGANAGPGGEVVDAEEDAHVRA